MSRHKSSNPGVEIQSNECVYFIQAGRDGPIKIGRTTGDPNVRLADIQVGSPAPLRLIGFIRDATGRLEAQLHDDFLPFRLRGEWFEPSRELTDFIKRHATIVGEPVTVPSMFSTDPDEIDRWLATHPANSRWRKAKREDVVWALGMLKKIAIPMAGSNLPA